MKNKLVDIILILLILAIFVSYFTIIDRRFGKKPFIKKLNLVQKYVRNENWEQAEVVYKKIEEEWNNYEFLIMLNYGEAEFAMFEQFLGHIKAGIEGEDQIAALSYIKPTKNLWRNIKRIVPQP